jgi:A/G-specific adenine glycosylase
MIKQVAIRRFQEEIWRFYRQYGRSLPWRKTKDPYRILVSEIMLQQTQVGRVLPKYESFIASFDDFYTLAQASLHDIFHIWQGLGYNRRALALRQIAKDVVTRFNGTLPADPVLLRSLPGIGPYTAGAIAAFAFHQPTVFVDTNIRTVFWHYFLKKNPSIDDRHILPLVASTLDQTNPREWYYALFDYGAMLKDNGIRHPRHSRNRQCRFEGSNRQLRGHVIRLVVMHTTITEQELVSLLQCGKERLMPIVQQLHAEGFLDVISNNIKLHH